MDGTEIHLVYDSSGRLIKSEKNSPRRVRMIALR